MEKSLGVIILNWNQKKYLKQCIESVIKQSFKNIEIAIIDNDSADASPDFIKKEFPQLKFIQNETNIGWGRAHNRVIAMTQAEFILLLNVDLVLEENFILEMVEAIESGSKIGMAQPKLYQFSRKEERILDSTGIFLKKNRRNFDRGYGEIDKGQYSNLEYVFAASGAAPLYRREMLEDIKIDGEYFDEDFFAYREEVDLAWRMQLAGWKCIYAPGAVAYHYRTYSPARRKNMPKQLRRLQYRNRYLMLIKNELPYDFVLHLPYIFLFELSSFLYALFFEPFLFLAWPQIITLIPKMLRKHKVIMQKRKVPASYILSMIR